MKLLEFSNCDFNIETIDGHATFLNQSGDNLIVNTRIEVAQDLQPAIISQDADTLVLKTDLVPLTKQMKIIFLSCFILGITYAANIKDESLHKIIEEVNSRGTIWKAGENFGSDVTLSSIKRLLGLKKSGLKLPLREAHDIPDSEIPEEFDARKQWPNCPTIAHIRNQGNCGSCWAVAAASTLSDRMCIASNGSFTLPLSEQEVLSCCDECGDGCNGGVDEAAWRFFAYNGIVTGGDYQSGVGCQPYSIESCEHHTEGPLPPCSSLPAVDTPTCSTNCTNPSYETPFTQDHHRVESAYTVHRATEIQKEIMAHGPVEAGFVVYSDFPTYKSGVYQWTSGTQLGGHAVRIIGWGTENGTPYWLIANSWNERWGDKGLFKIRRGVDECGIESEISAGVPLLD